MRYPLSKYKTSRRLALSLLLVPSLALAATRAEDSHTPVSPPVVLHQANPLLPEAAAIGAEGRSVRLELVVDTGGSVREARVIGSAGHVLDAAALRAIRKSEFEPARRGTEAISSRILYELRFANHRPERKEAPPPEELAPSESESTDSPPPSVPPKAQMDEVVVTGSRTTESMRSSVVGVEVIRRRELEEAGALNLEEALFARQGLQVQRGFQGSALWIRGLAPEYTLVLINGRRVPGRINGALDLSRFPIESIERVEIVRGPSSALYGSDAIGGVVNIITREARSPLESDGEIRLGSEDSYAGNARVAGLVLPWLGLQANVGKQHTEAFRLGDSEATSGSERTLDTMALGLHLGESRENQLNARFDYGLTDLLGVDEGAGNALLDRSQSQELLSAELGHSFSKGRWSQGSMFTLSQFRSQYLVDQRGSDALDKYEDSQERLAQLGSTTTLSWDSRHRSTWGGELLLQELTSPRLVETGHRTRYSMFAAHRWRFGDSKQLSLVPGARLDVDSQFGSQLSPKLALRYDPLKTLTLRASYGRGFRAPSFQEQLLRFENPSVGYVVEGSTSLRAERSHGFDLAAEYTPLPELFLLVAAFRNDLSQMITPVTMSDGAAGTVFSYANLDRATTQGIDAQITGSLSTWGSLACGYTWTLAENHDQDRAIEGQAPHLLFARTTLSLPTTGLRLIARSSVRLMRPYYESQPDGDEELVYADPLAQMDLRLEEEFSPFFRLFLGVNNALNAGDQYASLLPRQYYAGLRGKY